MTAHKREREKRKLSIHLVLVFDIGGKFIYFSQISTILAQITDNDDEEQARRRITVDATTSKIIVDSYMKDMDKLPAA